MHFSNVSWCVLNLIFYLRMPINLRTPSMSDISDATFDVFLSGVNPEHSTATKETRVTRAASRALSPVVQHDDADDDDDDADDDENEDDEEDEDGDEDGDEDEDEENEEKDDARQDSWGIASHTIQERNYESSEDGNCRNDDSGSRASRQKSVTTRPYESGNFTRFMSSAPKREKTAEEIHVETMEKQSVLLDLQRLKESHDVPLSKNWSIDDPLDEMTFELKRIMLHMDEVNNVSMMRNALQLGCTGIEMLSKRFKILDLEGWSSEMCRDLSKHDRALGRMYRKYWRRSHASSPESEIALSLLGSIGMFHMRKMVSKRVFPGGGGVGGGGMSNDLPSMAQSWKSPFAAASRKSPDFASRVEEYDDDDDEDGPP